MRKYFDKLITLIFILMNNVKQIFDDVIGFINNS